ncbi:Yip1 family protein [Paenibacillus sp. sgz302251]|uniref:Yip1 family protein n=1 Tax=Paenibacillus sp. sgz302251 TaxID=3414493 RepID=UPI003C7EB175
MNMIANLRQVLTRPMDFFYDLQFERRANWFHAIILIVCAVIVRLITLSVTGYSFEAREPYQISFVFETVWIIVPWLTWAISNWAVGTILDGEGKFKDILVASSYALTPYILLMVPISFLSRILSQGESSIYNFLLYFTYLWVVFLYLLKVKVLHDFELGKLFLIVILTIIGMLIMWFIALLLTGLINQVITFALDLIREVRFRL